jgi:phage terminase large subunit-like protein
MSNPTMTHTPAQALKFAEAAAEHRRTNKRDFFHGYPPQKDFFNLGADKRERMFMAGTQVGKSEAGAFEMSCHLTGEYPDDWQGKRFARPVRAWVAGVTSLDVRNIIQRKLCGEPGVTSAFGTGMIPKSRFADKPTMSRGIAESFDTIQVTHRTNGVVDGISTCHFKSYEQGRQKFQGDTIDIGWADEEADMDVYSEFASRLSGDGILYTTFTPLLGQTDLVSRFINENRPDCGVVHMTLSQAEHFTAEEKAKRLAGYRSHEKDARERGVPMLGQGRVWTFAEDTISHTRDPASIPLWWPWLNAIDFAHASGSENSQAHPFAWVSGAIDPDNDVIYIMHALKIKGSFPINHVAAIKKWPAWDARTTYGHDGGRKDFGSGKTFAGTYKELGLRMTAEHATFKTGGYDFENSIDQMSQRFNSGRLLVAKHLSEWFEEYRFLHREDLAVVKIRDDLISCTRLLCMTVRSAQLLDPDRSPGYRRRDQVAAYSAPDALDIWSNQPTASNDIDAMIDAAYRR